jgi:hypothetical protein
MASGDQPKFDFIQAQSVTTAVRDTLVCEVGTVIWNTTTSKLNVCKSKAAGAGSWEAVTSA